MARETGYPIPPPLNILRGALVWHCSQGGGRLFEEIRYDDLNLLALHYLTAGSGRKGCAQVLRDLKRNPPNHTVIQINIRLFKAKYICHKGFILSGSELRTCRRGRWREKEDPKCLGNNKWFKNDWNPIAPGLLPRHCSFCFTSRFMIYFKILSGVYLHVCLYLLLSFSSQTLWKTQGYTTP